MYAAFLFWQTCMQLSAKAIYLVRGPGLFPKTKKYIVTSHHVTELNKMAGNYMAISITMAGNKKDGREEFLKIHV